MPEDYIIRHCAPTLAGIKTGSIFTCPYDSKDLLRNRLRQVNRRLRHKGLRVLPLRFSDKNALIYVYRPKRLCHDLNQTTATALLQRYGYNTESCQQCVVKLAQKLRQQGEFPHEIGLFLGYPPEDVRGFIDCNGCCYKCVGCWKVYGDEQAARKRFALYKKCAKVYLDQWEKGKDIERLTVAG